MTSWNNNTTQHCNVVIDGYIHYVSKAWLTEQKLYVVNVEVQESQNSSLYKVKTIVMIHSKVIEMRWARDVLMNVFTDFMIYIHRSRF